MIQPGQQVSASSADADLFDPDNLELAQAAFNEELLYEAIASFAHAWFERTQRPARILDLCAATGLTAKRVAQQIPTQAVTLVDSDSRAIERSRGHFSGDFPIERYCTDAVRFNDGKKYDLILANSAYHHVEDDRKVQFLTNATESLERGGQIILGENFLPPSSNRDDYGKAVTIFYESLTQELRRRGTSEQAISFMWRVADSCRNHDGEYKVSWKRFTDDLDNAGIRLVRSKLLWKHPLSAPEMHVGSVAAVLQSRVDVFNSHANAKL